MHRSASFFVFVFFNCASLFVKATQFAKQSRFSCEIDKKSFLCFALENKKETGEKVYINCDALFSFFQLKSLLLRAFTFLVKLKHPSPSNA